MLIEISILDFVIIKSETVKFSNGFNVITGETGSGKSLLIDCISIIMGGKFTKEHIRQGSKKSIIQALFDTPQNEDIVTALESYGISIEEDNILLISREINQSGRSICRINGQIVTLSILKQITSLLIDVVGQNEHQTLLDNSNHIKYTDDFVKDRIKPIKIDLKLILEKLDNYKKQINSLIGNPKETERKLDLIRFQIDDIENANLSIDEEEQLRSRKNKLINSERLYNSITKAIQFLYDGDRENFSITDKLSNCSSLLQDIIGIDKDIDGYSKVVDECLYQLEDIKHSIRSYRDNIEFNDDELLQIQERLDLISKLKRKYGNTIAEIIDYKNNIKNEYEKIKNSENLIKECEQKISDLTKEFMTKAQDLTKIRKDSSKHIESLVQNELNDLNMKGCKFVIDIISTSNMTLNGFDVIEFKLSTNPKEEPKSITKIASGGEISRVMLSLKNVFVKSTKLSCIVFDEIDAGIGGITADIVGSKLKALSYKAQTICITHLAQIACYGDTHILITKSIKEDCVDTSIVTLDEENKIKEIARMLSGLDNNDLSLKHAKELISKRRLPN